MLIIRETGKGLPANIKNTKDIDSFKRRLFNKIFHTK